MGDVKNAMRVGSGSSGPGASAPRESLDEKREGGKAGGENPGLFGMCFFGLIAARWIWVISIFISSL